MNVTISVTQADIDDGRHRDCTSCPLALAVRRALPSLPGLSVGNWGIFPDPRRDPIELPDTARIFVATFDADLPVEPFSFTIDVPAELVSP